MYCRFMDTATHRDALARFGCALSDPTRAELLLLLRHGPGYPSDALEAAVEASCRPAPEAQECRR